VSVNFMAKLARYNGLRLCRTAPGGEVRIAKSILQFIALLAWSQIPLRRLAYSICCLPASWRAAARLAPGRCEEKNVARYLAHIQC
jgi:hypothetical protein